MAQGAFLEAREFRLSASRPAGTGTAHGPGTYTLITPPDFDDNQLTVADIVLWDTQPTMTLDDDALLVETIPPSVEMIPTPGINADEIATTFTDELWPYLVQDGVGDARLIEDRLVSVSAQVRYTLGGSSQTGFMTSGAVLFQGSEVPPSRGRPCTAGPDGVALDPCPFTDGDFSDFLTGSFAELGDPSLGLYNGTVLDTNDPGIVIDMGAPVDVGLVVARCGHCVVSVSADGQRWAPLGVDELDPAYYVKAFTPFGPLVARWVRIDEGFATEVSVWPPARGGDGPPHLGLLNAEVVLDRSRVPDSAGGRLAAATVAILLAASVTVAAALELRRNRSGARQAAS